MHTQGRIRYHENGDANSYALLDADGQWLMTILHNGHQVTEQQRENLLAQGYRINGVSIQRSSPDGVTIERGAVTTGGMVLWRHQDNTDLLAEAHKRIAELEAAYLEQVDLTISLRDRLNAESA